jgi:two-component system cell cycle sensor histidine kinase/response regulator CckA
MKLPDMTEVELLAGIVGAIQDGILAVRVGGRILFCNEIFGRMWNTPSDLLASHDARRLMEWICGQVQQPEVIARNALAMSSSGQESVAEHKTQDGRVLQLVARSLEQGGQHFGSVWFCRDVTERLRDGESRLLLEAQLRQAQKMEALGQLAGGVAHDFNNLLVVVLNYCSMALEECRAGDPIHDDLEQIMLAAQRATQLTRQLLTFSRRQVPQVKPVSLLEVVTKLTPMLKRLLRSDIELTVSAVDSLGNVMADPGQMEQVVMNLVVNAQDAMHQGGSIYVGLRNEEILAAPGQLLTPGAYVALQVRDNGVGMDAETQARIFEPFFTTKASRGTGLGLSTVHSLVRAANGDIKVESAPGQGTTFTIYLPRVLTDDVEAPARVPARPVRGGRETLLLVEDDEAVRKLLHGALQRWGYGVVVAANAGDALLAAELQRGKIDLLVSDVVMQRMNGPALARKLRTSRPDMRVLFISGYAGEASTKELTEVGAFLQKPFTGEELCRKVREVLDAV